MKQFSHLGRLASVVLVFFMGASAVVAGDDTPAKNGQSDEYVISYSDLDLFLSGSVIDVGPSDRKPASRKGAKTTSSKIKHGNTSPTAFEGNRVTFHKFTQEHVDYLLALRKDLEAVPDFMPLKNFSSNEQLAYWLNLHNVAVMVEVAEAYPIKKVKNLVSGRNSVWQHKTMSVNGREMSIQDIEDHVIKKWNDPLVLYGFFMGSIGGPNIRPEAYTGDNVAGALQENAFRFVNSLRGFRLWSGSGRVSDHYKLGERYFPDFEKDIVEHMLAYARTDTRRDLERAKSIKINNYDWGIADPKDGDTYSGGSFNTNPGALGFFINLQDAANPAGGLTPPPTVGTPLDSIHNSPAFNRGSGGKISPQTKALLRAIKMRNERRNREGVVSVEEFIGSEGSRIRIKEPEVPDEEEGAREDTNEGGVLITD